MRENVENTEVKLTPARLYAMASAASKPGYICLLDGHTAYTSDSSGQTINTKWATVYTAMAKNIRIEDSKVVFDYNGDTYELRFKKMTEVDPYELIAALEVQA